jgi:toxin ParE1/3/4
MSLPLVFQAGVRDDVDDAYAWYEDRQAGLGEQFLAEVHRVLDRIEQDPELHAPIYQAVRHGRLKRFPYAVYYRVEPDRIVVIAIHHNKRNPRSWQSRA